LGEVNVGELQPGMKLAQDLKDANGRFLLGSGAVIEAKHIRIMKIWGITGADIEGVNQDELAKQSRDGIDSVKLAEASAYVDLLFSGSQQDHDALQELKHLAVMHYAVNGSKYKDEREAPGKILTRPDERVTPMMELVEKNIQLSSFPDIYYQIMNVINDSYSSASHLAEVVSRDPGLSATLLKLVNSAYFGLPKEVNSIARAIALIGGKELSALAMGISVIRYFKDIPPEMVDMRRFWLHSVACGVFARILASRKVELPEELFFTAGMLHDIGRLVMYVEYPRTAAYLIGLSLERKVPLNMLETEILGYDHAQVTGRLLERWNFPQNLTQLIRDHHQPMLSRYPLESSLLAIADIIATALEYGYSGSHFVPVFEKDVWETAGLPISMLDVALKQAKRQVEEILQAFNQTDEVN